LGGALRLRYASAHWVAPCGCATLRRWLATKFLTGRDQATDPATVGGIG
jgi:hypothetical protein